MNVTMRDDSATINDVLKDNSSQQTRSKRDDDDKNLMKFIYIFNLTNFKCFFLKNYRHIVTLGRKDNVTLILRRDDKRDDARFIVTKRTTSSRY
jgi:hypothetical protein